MANPLLIKVAASFGGGLTDQLIDRQNRLNEPVRKFLLDGLSLAVIGGSPNNVLESDDGLLVITGHPVELGDTSGIRSAGQMIRLFERAEGAFAALYWDKRSRELTTITDFLGAQPIYTWRDGDNLHVATETKAFNAEPSPAGWGAFLAFGHPIGERTLADNVDRLPGGSVITIDARSKSAQISSYWSPPYGTETASISEVAQAFRDSVRAYEPSGRDGTLLLSGGYDSRLVLFGLLEAGIPFKARIFAHRDENLDADRRLAERLSRSINLDFEVIYPEETFFSTEAYLDYISDTDAQTQSLHLFIAQVAAAIPGPAIWEGLVPSPTLLSGQFPSGGFDSYVASSCSGPGSVNWEAARLVLRSDFYHGMEKGFHQDLEAEIARFRNDDYGVYWFLGQNRARNRTGANSFKAFPQYAATCLPGLSKAFWEAASSIPKPEKANHRFYRKFLAETYPEALELPFVTGSTLMPGKNRFSPYYRLNRAAIGAQKFLGARPNLARTIPFLSHVVDGIEPSRWLNLEVLAGDDPYIDQERLSRLNPDDPLYNRALTFLFHWKAWRWLHQGHLKEQFLRPLDD